MDKLRKSFDGYLSIIANEFTAYVKNNRKDGTFRLLELLSPVESPLISNYALNPLVNKAEEHSSFHHLIKETQATYAGKAKCIMATSCKVMGIFKTPVLDDALWMMAISNFFRRSGYYFSLYEEKSLDSDDLFERYKSAFNKEEFEITYLVPLGNIRFIASPMDFGDFKIKQFSEEELEAILHNRLNESFYQWAVVDVQSLKDYWFLCVTETISTSDMLSFIDVKDVASQRFTDYSQKVQYAIQILSVYNWGHKGENTSNSDYIDVDVEEELGLITKEEAKKKKAETKKTRIDGLMDHFYKFNIPFILNVDDNLFNFPTIAPSLSKSRSNELISKIDSLASGIIAEKMAMDVYQLSRPLHFDESETENFKASIRQLKDIIDNVCPEENFEFVHIALGYLTKAFFSEGLDQLLWHIAMLEALLGEKEEIRNRIARRVAIILGDTEAKREFLRKQINELYDFRSDMVHGNKFRKDVESEHLDTARQLARKTLLWFLNYLNYLKENQKEGGRLPDREEILLLLDLKEKKKLSVKELLDSLPQGFPNIKEWII